MANQLTWYDLPEGFGVARVCYKSLLPKPQVGQIVVREGESKLYRIGACNCMGSHTGNHFPTGPGYRAHLHKIYKLDNPSEDEGGGNICWIQDAGWIDNCSIITLPIKIKAEIKPLLVLLLEKE